jgi:hypothetical protein
MSGRKDPRNFGTAVAEEKEATFPTDPEANAGRYMVAMPERIILALFRSEVERLSDPNNRDDLVRLFSHFFDPMITEEERNSYVNNFQKYPPETVLGYPRSSAKFPCYAVVLESDEEQDEALDHLIGRTGDNENVDKTQEYLGSMYQQTYGAYVYAEHPDVCLYLYHFAKAILIGSHETLEGCGIIDMHLSGTELGPEETYIPENMFVRVVRITMKSLFTVPEILRPDPARVRITGIWADDIVVSGMRGGVKGVG